MLYWYHDLMLDERLKRRPKRHIFRVERYYRGMPKSVIFRGRVRWWERFVGTRIPWREYTLVTRAANPENLFDVIETRHLIFRHFLKRDFYVVGLYTSRGEALGAMLKLIKEGYESDPSFDPRVQYSHDEDFDTYSDIEVKAVDIGKD